MANKLDDNKLYPNTKTNTQNTWMWRWYTFNNRCNLQFQQMLFYIHIFIVSFLFYFFFCVCVSSFSPHVFLHIFFCFVICFLNVTVFTKKYKQNPWWHVCFIGMGDMQALSPVFLCHQLLPPSPVDEIVQQQE